MAFSLTYPRNHTAYRYLTPAGVWLVALGLLLVVYLPFLNASYFSDDLLMFFGRQHQSVWSFFTHVGNAVHAYRPLESAILSLIQVHVGFTTWPIHILSLSAHALVCYLTLRAAMDLHYQLPTAIACGGICLFSQFAEPAVLGNDTMSQVISTMLCSLALALVFRVDDNVHNRWMIKPSALAASALCYVTALYFKETALGYLFILTLLPIGIMSTWRTPMRLLRDALWHGWPYLLGTAIYFVARWRAGGILSGQGPYSIHFNINVFRNLFEFGLASFNPVSTVTVYRYWKTANISALVVIAVATIFFCAVLGFGAAISRRGRLAAVLAVCAGFALFPAFLLQHVSELYLYNALPFVTLLIGALLDPLWSTDSRKKTLFVSAVVLLICASLVADRQKARLMYENGERAARMMENLATYIQSAPANSDIVLSDADGKMKYSVYILQGFDVLEFGADRLGVIYGRPDVNVRMAKSVDQEESMGGRPIVLFRLIDDMPEPADIKSGVKQAGQTTSAILDSRSLNKR